MNDIQKKRIEEAAGKFSESCRPDKSLYGLGVQIGYLQGFLKGSEYALTHQWISVDEALPEVEGDGCSNFVLAKFNDCIPEIAKYTDNTYTTLYSYKGADGKKYENHWFGTYANPLRHDITHWMPIPKFETEDREEIP